MPLAKIIERYEVLLIDAYGVLVDDSSCLPHARNFLQHLEAIGKDYFILTNGSSKQVGEASFSYAKKGLAIAPSRIISSGMVTSHWLKAHAKKKFLVLGPSSSYAFIEEAGCTALSAMATEADGVVITDQSGYDFVSAVDNVINLVLARRRQGLETLLILANPDLVYPAKPFAFGVTSGVVAQVIESALAVILRNEAPKFIRIGKPYLPIFDFAKNKIGHKSFLMIGDQLDTDILGANQAGIDSLLVGTGICDIKNISKETPAKATFILHDLEL